MHLYRIAYIFLMHQEKEIHHLSAGTCIVSVRILLVFLIPKVHPLKGMLYRNHKIFTEMYQRKWCIILSQDSLPESQHISWSIPHLRCYSLSLSTCESHSPFFFLPPPEGKQTKNIFKWHLFPQSRVQRINSNGKQHTYTDNEERA